MAAAAASALRSAAAAAAADGPASASVSGEALTVSQLPRNGSAAGAAALGSCSAASPILSESACTLIDDTTELDYLTQVVFRMYENKTVPVDAPERFRVEMLFSPGTNYSPFDVVPLHNNHVLPTLARTVLSKGEGVTLAEMEERLSPFAQTRKYQPCSYALQYSLKAPVPASRFGSMGTFGGLRSQPSFNQDKDKAGGAAGSSQAAAAAAPAAAGADSETVETPRSVGQAAQAE